MRIVAVCIGSLLVLLVLLAAGTGRASAQSDTPVWPHQVVAQYPHDATLFTEGLAMLGDRLVESGGRYGASRLLLREVASGRVLGSTPLGTREFGEGATVVGPRILQLTWRNGLGYIYDLALHRTGQFAIPTEGWGLAYDGRYVIRSDGSERLRFLDPDTLNELRSLVVSDQGRPLRMLNELEAANGLIYANVWKTDRIAAIDPASGRVRAWIDLAELRGRFDKPADWNAEENVLNGIAYDADKQHFYVTGKCWPALFEISVGPQP
jgi:glutamine cyclotransferase